MSASEVPPGSSRILQTSRGAVRMTLSTTSGLMTLVDADGWCRVDLVDGGVRVERSCAGIAAAFHGLGLPAAEAEDLGGELFERWEAIPRPPRPTPVARARRARRLVWLLFAVLGRLPAMFVELARSRRNSSRGRASALLGTREYGTRRIARSSVGMVEFEFWAEPAGQLGIYREDGWLLVWATSRTRFKATEEDAISALATRGVPREEAEEIGKLVIRERLNRIAVASV